MVGDLDAVEILLIQSRKKLRLSLRAVIRGNVWRLDKLSCSYPDLTAAESLPCIKWLEIWTRWKYS